MLPHRSSPNSILSSITSKSHRLLPSFPLQTKVDWCAVLLPASVSRYSVMISPIHQWPSYEIHFCGLLLLLLLIIVYGLWSFIEPLRYKGKSSKKQKPRWSWRTISLRIFHNCFSFHHMWVLYTIIIMIDIYFQENESINREANVEETLRHSKNWKFYQNVNSDGFKYAFIEWSQH